MRNESKDTRAHRIVIVPANGRAMKQENLPAFSMVHSFERGQAIRIVSTYPRQDAEKYINMEPHRIFSTASALTGLRRISSE